MPLHVRETGQMFEDSADGLVEATAHAGEVALKLGRAVDVVREGEGDDREIRGVRVGGTPIGETVDVRGWKVTRVSQRSVDVVGPDHADRGIFQHDGYLHWDRPESVPEYVKAAAYRAVGRPDLVEWEEINVREGEGDTRADLAALANSLASQSHRGGAPRLRADSSREDVIDWLQWNDPNGVHTDDLAKGEDIDPYTHDGAWDALASMLEDERLTGASEAVGYGSQSYLTSADAGPTYPRHAHCARLGSPDADGRTSYDANHDHAIVGGVVQPADDGHDHDLMPDVACPTRAEEGVEAETRDYRGKGIEKLFPSGYYEVYSDVEGRFIKFDTLSGAKAQIDKDLEAESDEENDLDLVEDRATSIRYAAVHSTPDFWDSIKTVRIEGQPVRRHVLRVRPEHVGKATPSLGKIQRGDVGKLLVVDHYGGHPDDIVDAFALPGQEDEIAGRMGTLAHDAEDSADWGTPYGAPYETSDGAVVHMRRHRQHVRFVDEDGEQVGPEQPSVAAAVAYAESRGWQGRFGASERGPSRWVVVFGDGHARGTSDLSDARRIARNAIAEGDPDVRIVDVDTDDEVSIDPRASEPEENPGRRRLPSNWTDKDIRKYEHIKRAELDTGVGQAEAKRIAAATVNRDRAERGARED